mgnify:CR=1 FL=1
MSISQAFIQEVKKETDSTRRLLTVINDEHLSWTPHQKSMTVAALAGHIVELHNWISSTLAGEGIDFAAGYQSFIPTTAAELKARLDESVEANIATLNSLSDEDWNQLWTLRAGDHVIVSLPRIAAVRFLIQNHLIHHRGQLSVYLRMLDLPIPGMYGPSADER